MVCSLLGLSFAWMSLNPFQLTLLICFGIQLSFQKYKDKTKKVKQKVNREKILQQFTRKIECIRNLIRNMIPFIPYWHFAGSIFGIPLHIKCIQSTKIDTWITKFIFIRKARRKVNYFVFLLYIIHVNLFWWGKRKGMTSNVSWS